jgi:hypothetical protein
MVFFLVTPGTDERRQERLPDTLRSLQGAGEPPGAVEELISSRNGPAWS